MKQHFGTVSREKEGYKVAFTRMFNHPIQKVWDAISDPSRLKVWFTDIEMKPQAGSPMKIVFRDAAKTVTNGEVVEFSPPHRFVWTWEGELAVWELSAVSENETELRFTYSKLDDKYAVGASGGFHTLLDRLEKMLAGSRETYAFGTEEFDPEQTKLREQYGEVVFDQFPHLEKHSPITVERTFQVGVAKLWEALTDNEKLKQWYFDFGGKFKPEPGVTFDWNGGPPDGKQWHHRGKVMEVDFQKKIVHTWEYPGYKGQAKLTWVLEPAGTSSSKLKLHFEFIEPFDFPEGRRKNFVAGWDEILNQSLVKFLEG